MASGTYIDNGRSVENEHAVRRMRCVAYRAVTLGHGHVLYRGVDQTLHGVLVTGTAEFSHGLRKELVLHGSMRGVTIDATPVVQYRPVHALFAQDVVYEIIMASLADFVSNLLEFKRIRRRRFHVALIAHLVLDRNMNIVIKDSCLVRSMGVMARSTPGILHGIIIV
jgi:hypothetical protein